MENEKKENAEHGFTRLRKTEKVIHDKPSFPAWTLGAACTCCRCCKRACKWFLTESALLSAHAKHGSGDP